jgi:hypothetical protein
MPDLSDLLKSLGEHRAGFTSADVHHRVIKRRQRRRGVAGAIGATALLGLGAVAWQLNSSDSSTEIRVIAPTPSPSAPRSVDSISEPEVSEAPPTTLEPVKPASAVVRADDQVIELNEQPPCPPGDRTCSVSGALGTLQIEPGDTIELIVDSIEEWEIVEATFSDAPVGGQSPSIGVANFNILTTGTSDVLRMWVAPPRAAPIGPWESRFFAVNVVVSDTASVYLDDKEPTQQLIEADEPLDLPALMAMYSYESNRLVLRDRGSGNETLLSDFGGPLDPTGDGFCADGCGAMRLVYDAGDADLRYTGAGAGSGTAVVISTSCDAPKALCDSGIPSPRAEAMASSVLASDRSTGLVLVEAFGVISMWDPVSDVRQQLTSAFRARGVGAGALSRDGSAAFVTDYFTGKIWRLDTRLPGEISLFADLGDGIGSMEVLAGDVLVVSKTNAFDDIGRPTGPTSLTSLDIATGKVLGVVTIDQTVALDDVDASGRYLLLTSFEADRDQVADGTILWADLSTNTYGVVGSGSDAAW